MTTVSGADRMRSDLKVLAERAADLRPVWQSFDDEVWRPRQMAAFSVAHMAPLAKSTQARKRVNKDTPLVLTGGLRLATYRDSPMRASGSSALFGIGKGNRLRKLAILHKSSARLKHRDAVPSLARGERAAFKRILREHLMGDWSG